jgi:hypothetical protein
VAALQRSKAQKNALSKRDKKTGTASVTRNKKGAEHQPLSVANVPLVEIQTHMHHLIEIWACRQTHVLVCNCVAQNADPLQLTSRIANNINLLLAMKCNVTTYFTLVLIVSYLYSKKLPSLSYLVSSNFQ